jgi:hypothetical protein
MRHNTTNKSDPDANNMQIQRRATGSEPVRLNMRKAAIFTSKQATENKSAPVETNTHPSTSIVDIC